MVVANASEPRAFGEALGLGFQLRDDALGVWGAAEETGKDTADDIRRRKQALPVLLLRRAADDADRPELDRGLWPVGDLLFVGTLGAPACNAALMSYFMHLVPRRLLGRALSGATLLTTGAVPLAPVIAGVGLAWVGLTPALMATATICLLAVLALLVDRGLRTLPRPADWPEPQA